MLLSLLLLLLLHLLLLLLHLLLRFEVVLVGAYLVSEAYLNTAFVAGRPLHSGWQATA